MRRPGSATALLSAHGAGDGIVTVVRDLAVAAYALRARGLQLDVLLLDDGQERASTLAAKTAADYGLPLTAVAGPRSAGAAYVAGFRRVVDRARPTWLSPSTRPGSMTRPRSRTWSTSCWRRTWT
jgi:hypothetical protein